MHKIKFEIAPKIFQNKFGKSTQKYPTNFSISKCSMLPFKLSKSYKWGSTLWKNIPTDSEKMQESVTVF